MNIKFISSITNRLKTFFSVLLFMLLTLAVRAQDDTCRLFSSKYPFIKDNINVVSNDSTALADFYQKLQKLKSGSTEKVTIAHIGDSHIQADMFSGKIRLMLQREFGNGGRGLIFPYRVAKTNGPFDIRTKSNTDWDVKRVIAVSNPTPIGISGITICSPLDTSCLQVKAKSDALDYRFDKIKLFHEQNATNFDLMITDTTGKSLSFVKSSKYLGDYRLSTLKLDTLVDEIIIKSVRVDTTQKYSQFYGISLENNKPGILYDMIGVNGAAFNHYNKAIYFFEQLSYVKPDLIIISLGTNDSFDRPFDAGTFRKNVTCMIDNIRAYMPKTAILMTMPPDSFKKKKRKNMELVQIVNILTDICKQDNMAYWDLYHIMGGTGSNAKWLAKRLAQADRVHYTMPGYELQADMFYKALMDGYTKFKNRH